LDILSVLIESARSGADIHREIDSQFADGPALTTVYRALRGLEDRGLVDTRSRSGVRSKVHRATSDGVRTVRQYATVLTVRVQAAEYAQDAKRR
jgi:DNA-binding PadR family transcriptional regulator